LPLKCFVFVIKPLHHFGAWIRAIVRDFDDPSHSESVNPTVFAFRMKSM
jgi:hypothetical protein